MRWWTLFSLIFYFGQLISQSSVFTCKDGEVTFISNAPLEVIRANTDQVHGAVDTAAGSFAFRVSLKSFKGFNSPLQKTHFNENYVESSKFPNGIFQGKIIEQIDFSRRGSYDVRAKGILEIHGIQKERIIKGVIRVDEGEIHVSTTFTILLREYDIPIPKIVYHKIAEEITVTVNASMTPDTP